MDDKVGERIGSIGSIRTRVRNPEIEASALAMGLSALQARLIAGRIHSADRPLSALIRPNGSVLDGPELLPDIVAAAGLVADAVQSKMPIAIVTDHDADGATAHAIIRLSLLQWGFPANRLAGYLSHRLSEGYGISDALVDRMLPLLEPNSLIITADQGSTDEPRIRRLRDHGHLVLVTDHHGLPEAGPPASAHAVVNPVRSDSGFPDRAIAGCHTALLVMAAARAELIHRGVLSESSTPKVSGLMDLCAVGTMADASSLATSANNRAILIRGLQLMNRSPRACWRAMRTFLSKEGDWTSTDIAFQIAARINARGRLDDAMLGVEFLCTKDEGHAAELLGELDANNQQRRAIEAALTQRAAQMAAEQVETGRFGLCLWLGEDSHAGVHGITANRIVERFGRPTICLSPVSTRVDLVTGSVRTTELVHVRDTLAVIQRRWPGLLLSAGGHAGAGGLRIKTSDIQVLSDAWDACVREQYGQRDPEPMLLIDGEVESVGMASFEEIAALEPYGRGFEAPLFIGTWRVEDAQALRPGSHLRLVLSRGSEIVEGVWFNAKRDDDALPLAPGQIARFVFSLESRIYRGSKRLQIIVRGVSP